MAGNDLRDEYLTVLMENVRQSEYPSGQLLNRIEYALRSEERAEEYVELLLTKVQNMAPSLQLLDRIHRMLERLDLHRQLTS
jgi:Tfp pilus assembly protein PilF